MDKLDCVQTRYDLNNYKSSFSLSEKELQINILEIPDVYSSFNAELTEKGGDVISFYKLFDLSSTELAGLFSKEIINIVKNIEEVFSDEPEVQNKLTKKNEKILTKFLAAYKDEYSKARYVGGDILCLPFNDQEFGLALCCNSLFRTNDSFNFDRDLKIIIELLRVANKVKIFPLNKQRFVPCEYLGRIMLYFQQAGHRIEIIHANNETTKINNAILCIWNTGCIL